ncbi:uncharacterized protein LOC125757444 [Rhipicephalus sanguineus]|uniref:uncharacterized protein LOC125757444 n=1 Tax=Rhipicephalus sanguineus TaxID=34632 RepID=UPI0020C2ED93|nr:uncharacterized protein LOC125757444 [Rhipicephalus sanguineus]
MTAPASSASEPLPLATDASMAAAQVSCWGYDPEGMQWTTVPQAAPGDPVPASFRSAALNAAVLRRAQGRVATDAGDLVGNQQPPASHAAGRKGRLLTQWKPPVIPKPAPDDYVVVIKPRTRVSLCETFQETGYGRAFTALLGPQHASDLTIIPVREQNLIIVHTAKPELADRILGEFELNAPSGRVPLVGHLRQDGKDVCYGVVTVRNTDTTDSLRTSLQWRHGTTVEVRKFGNSNKARLTFAGTEKPRFVHYDSELVQVRPYQRTIPACGHCGVVGHRPDACPGQRPDRCGLCGQQAPLAEGVRAPHECNPKCAVCGGAHATGVRACTAKYRDAQHAHPKRGPKSKPRRRRRGKRHPSKPKDKVVDPTTTKCVTPPTGNQGKPPPPARDGAAKQSGPPQTGGPKT